MTDRAAAANPPVDPGRHLLTIAGVDWRGTDRWWLSFLAMAAGGIVLSVLIDRDGGLGAILARGVLYGFAIFLASFVHWLGHLIGGRLVGAPMTGHLVTSTRQINLYHDIAPLPRRVHLGRALGGPIANIGVGVLALLAYVVGLDAVVLLVFGGLNLVFGVGALAPLSMTDGGVVLRELRRPSG